MKVESTEEIHHAYGNTYLSDTNPTPMPINFNKPPKKKDILEGKEFDCPLAELIKVDNFGL